MQEKRKSKRFVLDASITMERVDGDKNKVVPIQVHDVSGTGIGFACSEILEMHSVYKIRLKLWTGDTIDSFVNILRFDNSGNDYIYGGTFIGMPENDANRLQIHEMFDAAENN